MICSRPRPRTRWRPCRRCRWPRGWTGRRGPRVPAGRYSSASRIGIEDGDDQRRLGPQRLSQEPGGEAARTGRRRRARRSARSGPRRRRLGPGREPRGVRGRGRLRPGPRARPPGRRRRPRSTTAAGSCQAPSGSSESCSTPEQRGQPGAQRLGGGQIADADDELGTHPLGEAGIAEQQVVGGDRGRRRGARPTRGRRAAASPGAVRVRGDGLRRPRRRARARPATITPRAGGRPGSAGVAAASAGDALYPGRPSARPGTGSSRRGASRMSGSRSGKLRWTGPGPPGRGGPVGAARELADPAQGVGRGRVDSHLAEPLDGVAVELELIDGLARRRRRAAPAGDRR